MTLTELIPILVSAFAGLFGWIVGRRKTAAEADTNELENVERALGIYRGFVDDLRKEIGLLRIEIGALTAQNVLLLRENRELKENLISVERTINSMTQTQTDGPIRN